MGVKRWMVGRQLAAGTSSAAATKIVNSVCRTCLLLTDRPAGGDPPRMAVAPTLGIRRHVGATLAVNFIVPSTIALQVAVAGTPGPELSDELTVRWGEQAEPIAVTDVIRSGPGRVHIITAPAGPLTINYSASIAVPPDPPTVVDDRGPSGYDDVLLSALRQSRYCPSDVLGSFALAELRPFADTDHLAAAAADWVFEHIDYGFGSSGPADSAIDTLVGRRGVCRDFAHLMISFCRAMGVPARFVSVYAPGLAPMDFHAVVEVWSAGRWQIMDPTRLAPRTALVRIATGRDAADTAFVMTLSGDVELVYSEVFAVIDGDLPIDDHRATVVLA
jgi:transglutaminase-like putative cysteine protease